MGNFNQLRKMAHVFYLYGITLSGKGKFDNLYKDLNRDQIFVLGLIFELELVTKNQMNDEDIYQIQAPAQIIQKLISQE
jgi:hypothetical protein